MIRVNILCVVFCLSLIQINAQTLVNAANRQHQSLDGQWKYIADPYENGYYNYRYEPFDQQENPGSGAFFLNSKASDKTDLVEYVLNGWQEVSQFKVRVASKLVLA